MSTQRRNNIAVINGHPDAESYCTALAASYVKGAAGSGASVREISLGSLQFNPNLQYGYRQRTELEPDLLAAQDIIRWADHLVFIYPLWWGTVPGILKGFIDRVFLPGFAFQTRPNSQLWDKLLTGKSARMVVTMDSPPWYFKLVHRSAGHTVMKRGILQFCGVNPVKITDIGPVKPSTAEQRDRWLQTVHDLGARRL
ncbi:NAD(P)H-dependent oxidoreductase [Paenibacillus tarimensis]|uniref:NAD(P)H-dependent oxidoreductase n=1 Tax=Paenibacillus tarimensis TaxID=416012 RepID=UPI001F22A071|nr:NAD(P)H-dependent oxidoreductase [Paenibacillus tarimensis]MCF2944383.1 NAD(P)H-dependent oxidoreductase [Paenibacillus tarimensis]